MTEPPTDTATESAAPPPEPGAPGASSSIDDQLAVLRSELLEARDRNTESSSNVAKFTAQIAALEALKKDLAKTQADYEAAHHELESQIRALTDYEEFERESLAGELKDEGLSEVDDVVDRAWSKLTKARTTVKGAEQEREVAEKQRDQRDEERAEALASMTAIKDLVGTIRTRIKQLQARKKQIDDAHADDHFGVAYWLLTQARFEPELDEKSPNFKDKIKEAPKLFEPDDLQAELERAVTAHNKAEADFADAEAELTKKSERLSAEEAALKSIEKTFLDDLAAELKLVKPVPEKTDHLTGEVDHG